MTKAKFTAEEARERKNARQREYAKRTGYAAQQKYRKENCKKLIADLYVATDSDIIKYIETLDNKAGYIKQLIREDMKRKGFTLGE